MINRKFAATQIARLSGLAFFGQLPKPALIELVSALQTNARSEAHAKAAVDQWLASSNEAPTPAELLRCLAALHADRQEKPRRYCNQCQRGWIFENRGGCLFSRRCDCLSE